MEIRLTRTEDLDIVMAIYGRAQVFMREAGNPTQWGTTYPTRQMVEGDIAKQQSYVCTQNGEIVAVFVFFCGDDPTYHVITDGGWPDDGPYGVIHRIAVDRHGCGVAQFCYDWCLNRCPCLRIDTHLQNLSMQRSLQKAGFTRCGVIIAEDGTPREAFYRYP